MSPFVFVIFGGTGDLARNKLLPALFSLFKASRLGKQFYIIGFSRRDLSDAAYAEMVRKELSASDDPQWNAFARNIYYQQGMFDNEDGYKALIERLNSFDTSVGACITRVFYLATPPDNYESILHYLDKTKLSEGCGQGSEKWTRVAIEKPFGRDLETAQTLEKKVRSIFDEKQVYRVDHYLGKETMRNMIAFRFANSIFEPTWNHKYIDHVQITWAEKEGVKTRGAFFESVGMLRDVGQNHLLQMLATVAMEQPNSFTKECVRDARANAIHAIKLAKDASVVRAQYEKYTEEKNVDPKSVTETFFAAKFFVDTPRFANVPFYVRAGKRMKRDLMEIKIVFKQTCHMLFKEYGCPETGNILTIRIQPDEGITLQVNAKEPGHDLSLQTVPLSFSYHETFGGHGADAYEKILLDVLYGDQMLFNRTDELESSWQLVTSILKQWKKAESSAMLPQYPQGSWGPDAAYALITKEGRKWL